MDNMIRFEIIYFKKTHPVLSVIAFPGGYLREDSA